jgi:prevent-host-death family protein
LHIKCSHKEQPALLKLTMLVIKGSNAAVATTTEVRRNLKDVLEQARTARVYVTNDGELVGGIVSAEMMELLDEILADRELARVAEQRLAAIRSGEDTLLDEDEFWARAGLTG